MIDFARLGALTVAVFVSLAALAIGGVSLGVDLRGGTRLEYTLASDAGGTRGDEAIDQAREVIAHRLDAIGMDASVVARGGAIIVDLQGDAEALDAARSVLAIGGRLALLEIDDTWTGPSEPLAPGVSLESESLPTETDRFLGAYGPDARELLLAAVAGERLPTPDHALLVGPWDEGARTYLVVRSGGIDGTHVVDADLNDGDFDYGLPGIMVEFDTEGALALENLTRRLAGRRLAIVVDDVVASAPLVMEPISGGRASITVGADANLDDARALAMAIRGGALPAPLVMERESLIGASISSETRLGAAVGLLAVWLLISAIALVRFRPRGLAIALGVPLTSIVALSMYGVALDGTVTAGAIGGLAVGALISAASSAALLEGGARSWRAAPWIVGAASGVAVVVTTAMTLLTTGPTRALASSLGCALFAAAFVSLTLTSSVAARPPR